MKCTKSLVIAAAVAVAPMLFGAAPASAGANGRKTTMEALGAITIYEALKGHTGGALAAGAATAYAYKQFNDKHRQERWDRYYDRGYGRDDGRYSQQGRWSNRNGGYRDGGYGGR